ncbi:Uncharacterized conserved protein PhnB, glyoxalase superfamily [Amycolatopsis marina]|uniref:Uncharacterized conserved protein PhnB, glyoxalase superfamily n=2 Tax=Amycolatopsis marina TaxID=490629 RepID=A0A1I1CH65_9PSEU|nr:Uncharacterized conserved protein PhnB, glyoxalase superfamily [Amycolatopsis marina]
MTVNPIPEGYNTVTPWLISQDTVGLIDYVKEAFDAEELGRVTGEDGRIGHAEVRIGDSVVMMFDAPPNWPATPGFLRLYVEDADAVQRHAVEAGGTEVTRVTHQLFGDRVGRVSDPFGNLWWIHTRVEDVSEAEVERRFGDPDWLAAMRSAQDVDFVPGQAR